MDYKEERVAVCDALTTMVELMIAEPAEKRDELLNACAVLARYNKILKTEDYDDRA